MFSPHWQTYIGTHFLGVEKFKNLSVDPVFPNLFRYHYEMDVDVKLAETICNNAAKLRLADEDDEKPRFQSGLWHHCFMSSDKS